MRDYLIIAPLETLKKAVVEKWPHKVIGQIAIDAEDAGISPDVIARILSGIRKQK